jgi:hypothetical protein
MRAALAVLLLLGVSPAEAQSFEPAYFTARDRAAAELRTLEEHDPPVAEGKPEYFSARFRAEYDRRHGDLAARLRSGLGALRDPAGFAGKGTLNPALCCYGRLGVLDGLRFERADGSRLIVSTDALLRRWLPGTRNFWPDGTVPDDLSLVFRNANFYQWSGATDWPVLEYARLPIGRPAFLVSAGPGSWPDWVALSVARDGRITVALFHPATPIAPIAACEAVGLHQLEAYRDCWGKQAAHQSWYPRLLREASAFAQAID